jgi:hypothetical protein
MKRMSIVGLCLIAAFAMSAIAVASASAEAPEFGRCLKKATKTGSGFSDAGCTKAVGSLATYEWTTTIINNKVTSVMTSEKATLESEGGTKISCTKQKTPAFSIEPPKSVSGVVGEYTGCASSAVPCESTATSGEINTTVLEGEIGLEKLGVKEGKLEPKLNKIANVLYGPGGKSNGGTSKLAEFHCTGLLEVEVEGSIMHPITANKMLVESVEKFTATKGEQKPTKFEGEACLAKNPVLSKDKAETGECDNHQLVSKLKAAGEFEESGQSQTNKNKSTTTEKIEVNTIV